MYSLGKELINGFGSKMTVSDIVNVYKDTVNLSTPTQAKIRSIGDSKLSIAVTYTATSCDTLETSKTSSNFYVDLAEEQPKAICVSTHNPVADRLILSNDGRYVARLRKASNNGNQLVEIWDNDRLIRTLDTSELEEHGPINIDNTFGNFSWSDGKLLYVCQAKKQKHVNFFKLPKNSSNDSSKMISSDFSDLRGGEFIREENWGESLTNIVHTLLAIYDIKTNTIRTINIAGISLAAPEWLCNGKKIVCVGYNEEPRKLGLVYCNNRSSKLLIFDGASLNLEREIEHNDLCYHTVRVNNAGNKFLYLSNSKFGPHHHSVDLNLFSVNTNESECIRSEVFVEHIPRSCFYSDDNSIVLVVQNCLHQIITQYDIKQRTFTEISSSHCSVLDFKHDVAVVVKSSIRNSPVLQFNHVKSKAWLTIPQNPPEKDESSKIDYHEFTFDTPDGPITALLAKPKCHSETILPTICNVHGGPHGSYLDTYFPSIAMNAELGLQTLVINYRGSSGISQNFLEKLCGHVGTMDVNDCLFIIKELIRRNELDPEKLILAGGSHGGFLAGHMSCQSEIKFKCAIIRNPVTDISTMPGTSDIPDWAFNEALGHKHFDFKKFPNARELSKMYDCSPISKISEAQVPTLMLLGNQDNRVKMFQGERWVDSLKARGIEVQCKIYNDKHALDKPEVASDAFITAAIWVLEHLHI